MDRDLTGKKPSFHRQEKSTSFYRVMALLALIVGSVWLLLMVRRREIISPFEPTPTPTRISESFFLEAQAYFDSGVLDNPGTPTAIVGQQESLVINDAIDAYQSRPEGRSEECESLGRAGSNPGLFLKHAAN